MALSTKTFIPRQNIRNSAIWRIKGENNVFAVGNVTKRSILRAPVKNFTKVRVWWQNSLTSAVTITGAQGAVTERCVSVIDKQVPSVGNTLQAGTGSTDYKNGWVPFFDATTGSATITLPAAPASPANSVTYTASAWQNFTGLVPTDSNGNPLFMLNCLYTTSNHSTLLHQREPRTLDINSSVYIETYNYAGDAVTNPAVMDGTNGTPSTTANFHAIEFQTNNATIIVLASGDSITQGQTASVQPFDNAYGYPRFMQELIDKNGLAVNMCNVGIAGGDPSISQPTATAALAAHKPAIHLISFTSPATYTLNTADIHVRRGLEVAQEARNQGALPIFVLLAPNNNPLPAGYAADLFRLDLVRRIQASGVLFWDLSTDITNYNATPLTFNPTMTIDGTHPNTAGYQAMGNLGFNALYNLLSDNELLARVNTF